MTLPSLLLSRLSSLIRTVRTTLCHQSFARKSVTYWSSIFRTMSPRFDSGNRMTPVKLLKRVQSQSYSRRNPRRTTMSFEFGQTRPWASSSLPPKFRSVNQELCSRCFQLSIQSSRRKGSRVTTSPLRPQFNHTTP
jgi:hypothetical protein